MSAVSEIEAEPLLIGHVFEYNAVEILSQPSGNIAGESLELFFGYDWSCNYYYHNCLEKVDKL